ncbi:acyl-CoA thioesterase [Rhizobium sp. TH2]|uniref:acyl-CoA thioesterase n=1 Tax=Rhizobium sp. TH2 TaxID=2775403 RepID=UPI002157609B|nr:thioesterase family protein [Rhizobium sp. TH2]UVC07969.1 acyl-CoA thioesterase [Rhizobium sp. TH2]
MFTKTFPLRFGDCDPSGIAYYPSYLRILDGAIEDFFASLGATRDRMISAMRMGTPTVTLNLVFERPGLQGDELTIDIRVAGLGRSSVDLAHSVSARGATLFKATHRLVATSLETHTSLAWPDDLRTALTQHLEKTNAHDPAT